MIKDDAGNITINMISEQNKYNRVNEMYQQ